MQIFVNNIGMNESIAIGAKLRFIATLSVSAVAFHALLNSA